MKLSYLTALLILGLGIALLIVGTTSTDYMTLLGVTFHPRIAKGVGIIIMIFSAILFLAAFGNAQAPTQVERRR